MKNRDELSPADGAPGSILVYARNRADLDAAVTSVARRLGTDPIWIEVVEEGGAECGEVERDPPGPGGPRRFVYRAEELLPNHALANLAMWVSGREAEPSRWTQEVEDLSWLPVPLRELTELGPDPRLGPTIVVVARAERLVAQLPLGLEDVRRLLVVLARRKVTLIAGLLVRPFPSYSELFDEVIRVGPSPLGAPPSLLLETPVPLARSPQRIADPASHDRSRGRAVRPHPVACAAAARRVPVRRGRPVRHPALPRARTPA